MTDDVRILSGHQRDELIIQISECVDQSRFGFTAERCGFDRVDGGDIGRLLGANDDLCARHPKSSATPTSSPGRTPSYSRLP